MPSSFQQFSFSYTLRPGYPVFPSGVSVKAFACDDAPEDIVSGAAAGLSGSDVDTLTTGANGLIAAGTLPVDPGTLIRFHVDNYNGISWTVSQITT